MTSLHRLIERPSLAEPVLILALEGWIDAGAAAVRVRDELLRQASPITVANFDGDKLLDHRARRPTMHLVDGVLTGLTWPSVELRAGTDRAGNDVLLLTGAEPDHQWRTFVAEVVELALEFDVRMVVGLGSYPAPVPHTRPSKLAVAASDPALATAGAERTSVEVPCGIQTAIEQAAWQSGIPAVGLWAQVPHYVATMNYPGAAVALLEGLERVGGLDFDLAAVAGDAADTRRRIDNLVASNDDHLRMVQQLELVTDPDDDGVALDGPLPSGDELAEELQRFLRDQHDD